MKNIICSYDDFVIYKQGGKFYAETEEGAKEVEEVGRVLITTQTEEELFDLMAADYTGELDNESVYCYWKIK